MEKDRIFFAEEGLTSTSANHIANLAKEMYQESVNTLENLQFYDESLTLLGAVGSTPIKSGATPSQLEMIPMTIENIGLLKSLISWLREAIKARKRLVEEIEDTGLDEYCAMFGIERPVAPEQQEPITEDEYLGTLGIKERNAYYALEARCATLGQYIHPGGAIAAARKRLNDVIQNPNVVKENGRDTIIVNRSYSVLPGSVEDMFFKLQAKHREMQAQLNAIKHKMDIAIEQDTTRKNAAYTAAYNEYRNALKDLQNRFAEWKYQQTVELEKLKIVIPANLERIYETVRGMGK